MRDDGSLCRIDFGRCFENLDKKYLGFHDYLKNKNLDYNDDKFQNGYNFEKARIRENLKNKRKELIKIISQIKNLEKDYDVINFNPERFSNRLIDHWSRIGFLEDINITDYQWV